MSAGPRTDLKGARILLVEDNMGDATLIEILLEGADHMVDIEHVRNGEEAINLIQNSEEAPDMILLDLKMPRMDGLEFLRVRKNDDCLSSIPTIVLTGSDAPSDKKEAMALGADGYMMKPGNIDEADSFIIALIDMMTRSRKRSSSKAASPCHPGKRWHPQ